MAMKTATGSTSKTGSGGGKVRLVHVCSECGTSHPKWSGDGRVLFFLSADGRMMWAPVRGVAAELFQTGMTDAAAGFAVTRDGERFLIPSRVGDAPGSRPATVVLNWISLMPRRGRAIP